MNCYRNTVLKLFCVSSFLGAFSIPVFAGDGPQNSARINLKKLDKSAIEATLQADIKIFSNPSDVYQFFEIRSKNRVCKATHPNMIANSDTVSAVATVECPEAVSLIQINLKSVDTLQAGFSLGVQTPLDHFALTKEFPSQETQLSAFQLFLKSGLTLGFKKNPRIGKPYALSFGGLGILPWGIWWLFLLIGLFVGPLQNNFKWVALGLACPVSGAICFYLLATESSLKYIPAPRLDSIFLTTTFIQAASGFFTQARWPKQVSSLLAALLICASGFDLAITLRWLEGNTKVSLIEANSAFFAGLWITTSLILGFIFYTKSFSNLKSSPVIWTRFSLMAVALYTFVCLNLQLL